jgi:hypothetical protein
MSKPQNEHRPTCDCWQCMNSGDRGRKYIDLTRLHSYDDDGCCVRCGFDGAEHAWLMLVLRADVGEDEYKARLQDNRPPVCKGD